MHSEYMCEYLRAKEQFEREVKKNPGKEHELTLLYSPVLNYLAVRYTEEVINETRLQEILARHQ